MKSFVGVVPRRTVKSSHMQLLIVNRKTQAFQGFSNRVVFALYGIKVKGLFGEKRIREKGKKYVSSRFT
jgi:hypothetical protein